MSYRYSAIWVGLSLASTSACNAFDHELPVPDPPGVALDAQSVADVAIIVAMDAAVEPPLGCDLTKPFGAGVPVEGLASSGEDASLRLLPDEKTAYFFSSRTGNQLLYTANRGRVADPFQNLAPLANVNTANQYNPAITADGSTLLFASFRPTGVGDNDLYQAARDPVTGDFVDPHPMPNVNTAASEVQPYVTHDGNTLYFVRTVSAHTTIFRASGSVTGGFRNAAPVPEVAGPTNDSDPVQSADGLTLFWSSDRPGALGGTGDFDVWQAKRATRSDPFGTATPVTSVNTFGLDAPSDVSENGCRLYLTSTRNGHTGIYVATRPQ